MCHLSLFETFKQSEIQIKKINIEKRKALF